MTKVIVNRRVDTEYNDALEVLLNHLGCDEHEITAEDYESTEECCMEMGWPEHIRNRIMDLIPCEESDEEIQAWKEKYATEADDENCEEF